jgi:hypothetical protein
VRFLDVEKLARLFPFSWLTLFKVSFPVVNLNVFSAYFGIRISKQNFQMVFRKYISYTHPI